MIIPAKKLLVITLRDREEEVLRRLGELGVIQLKKPSEKELLKLTAEEEKRLKELEKLYERFMEIWRTLAPEVAETPEEKVGQEAYQRYNSLRRRLIHLEAEERELKRRLAIVRALIKIGEKRVPETGKFQDIFSIVGVVSKKVLNDLKRKISGKPMILKYAPISNSEILVHIIGIIDSWNEIVNLLNKFGFEELSLKELSGDLKRIEENLQERLKSTNEEAHTIRQELENIKTSFIGFSAEEDSKLKRVKELHERFMELRKILSLEVPKTEREVKMEMDEVESIINEIYEKYNLLSAKLREIEDIERDLKEAKELINILKDAGIKELPELGEYENLTSFAGIIALESVNGFKKFAAGKPIAYDVKKIDENLAFIHVICLRDLTREVKATLSSLDFREVKALTGLPKNLDEARSMVEEKIRELDARRNLINREIQDLRERFRSKAGAISRFLFIRLRLDEALLQTMRSETMRVIQGWIPEDRVKSMGGFLESLKEEFDGKLLYEFRDPSPDEKVPTILKNPRIFRIFETLVRQYGWPGHLESDPTIVSGILWTIMFGMMFPDLGHGITIIALGIIFSRFLKKNILGLNFRKLGNLMIGLGISSAVFGVLMGEFFLMEIQPLFPTLRTGWLENPSGVVWLIKMAVFFGIAQILLALSISMKNHLRNRELAEAILGEKGIAGILLLLGLALTAFNFFGITVIPGILEFPELRMKTLMSWPFFILIAGLIMILVKPFFTREEKVMGIGLMLETFISFLANMFSYMRIAGFAIVHAALAMVVFRLMQANPLMGIGVGMIFLNLFALTIEFLVCMIQALRLLYYEFMTKFYQGTGTPYTPWKL
ncbi:MAG: hypothetical protein DRN49_06010 [Thaumarchaeota archaeon]|nr:MAG: hypothetical protein DRN49_06010 [Nitrososphaerota archaeon]